MATEPRLKETPKKNNSLRDFQGINTQAARQVIGDNQFAWLENVMPIGFGNMPAVPGPSASLATWTGTAYHMRYVSIGGVNYEMVFTTNGALYAVNLASLAVTTVAAAATLSGAGSEITQWSNTQAIIVDPTNGYYSWDGTTLKKWNGTLASLTITAIGTGYTSAPAIGGFGSGGGSGGAATCDIQVGLVTVTAAGATYNVGDTVTIAGGTFTRAATLRVSAIGGGGTITGINLTDSGDYTVAPANPAASTSPYGTGATFTLNFGIGPITLTAPGSGYTSAPTITVTGGAGTGGSVTANLAVVPSGGSSVTTFAGRVWVSSNRTIAFSAPNSFSDFSSTTAGGSFVVTDETLIGAIVALRSANNFMYIVGTSSVNVVADVSVVSGATVFSNTNISASVGTDFQDSIGPYYRGLWFANTYGVYALYGSTTQKMSDDLDGIFPLLLNLPGGTEISAGTVVIFEILCLAFLLKYNDPTLGARALLAVFFNKKWYLGSQGSSLVTMNTAVIAGQPTLYATDGAKLYKMFGDATVPVSQKIVTKLWDMGHPMDAKQAIKFGLELLNPRTLQTIAGSIDTEYLNGSFQFYLNNANVVQWVNNSGQVVLWNNNSNAIVNWSSTGYAFLPIDVQTAGRYLGITMASTSVGALYEGMHMQYEVRTPWPQGGAQ